MEPETTYKKTIRYVVAVVVVIVVQWDQKSIQDSWLKKLFFCSHEQKNGTKNTADTKNAKNLLRSKKKKILKNLLRKNFESD